MDDKITVAITVFPAGTERLTLDVGATLEDALREKGVLATADQYSISVNGQQNLPMSTQLQHKSNIVLSKQVKGNA